MTENIFTPHERKAFEALARRRGFNSAREFMRALLKLDAEQHGEAEDDLGDPFESFKRGWDDAMNGRVMSREEFRRRMRDDAG